VESAEQEGNVLKLTDRRSRNLAITKKATKARDRICEEISGLQAEKDSKLVTGCKKFNIPQRSSK